MNSQTALVLLTAEGCFVRVPVETTSAGCRILCHDCIHYCYFCSGSRLLLSPSFTRCCPSSGSCLRKTPRNSFVNAKKHRELPSQNEALESPSAVCHPVTFILQPSLSTSGRALATRGQTIQRMINRVCACPVGDQGPVEDGVVRWAHAFVVSCLAGAPRHQATSISGCCVQWGGGLCDGSFSV